MGYVDGHHTTGIFRSKSNVVSNHMLNKEMFAVVVSIHVVLLALAVVGLPAHHQLEARQSSDGCGPNPLVAVISYAREFADFSPHQLMRFIESDSRAGSQLRSLLRMYDDCVRTGDGTRYKKNGSNTLEMMDHDDPDSDPSSKSPTFRMTTNGKPQHSLEQANQSLLRALASHRLL